MDKCQYYEGLCIPKVRCVDNITILVSLGSNELSELNSVLIIKVSVWTGSAECINFVQIMKLHISRPVGMNLLLILNSSGGPRTPS